MAQPRIDGIKAPHLHDGKAAYYGMDREGDDQDDEKREVHVIKILYLIEGKREGRIFVF